MAKSLFNQFSQIRGSRTYIDDLPLTVSGVQVAELAGKAKELNLYVDVSGTTVTRTSGEFEKRDLGNVILIGGSAYGITTASGASCTVSSAPGDGSARPAALMYYQNLEDDLNYIRTMLKEITGLTNWYDPPTVALSELTFNFIELVDVFIGGGAYTPNNMLYTVSSGVKDSSEITFDPSTHMFTAANITTGGTLDVDGAADFDSSIDVAGTAMFQSNVTVSGSFQFDATGQAVNEIVTTVTESSTDSQLPTAAAVYEYVDAVAAGIDTFLELGDTFAYYTANNMMYTTATGISDTSNMTYTPGTQSIVFTVNSGIAGSSFTVVEGDAGDNIIDYSDQGGGYALSLFAPAINATADNISIEGYNSVMFAADSTVVNMRTNVIGLGMTGDTSNVYGITVSGAGFSGGFYEDAFVYLNQGVGVNQIINAVGLTGEGTPGEWDRTLPTVSAMMSYVNTNGAQGDIGEFIRLADAPHNYSDTKLVYSQADQIAYADNLSYNGSGLVVSGTLNTTGAVTFDSTLDVDGATTLNNTLDVDGATTLNSTLDVDAATTLNSTLDVDGATTLNSTLDVDGATTLNSSVTVSGAADFQSTVDVDGAATFNNTVDVDGATTLNSSLDVDGTTLLHSTIEVVGAAQFDSNVVASGTMTVYGATTINNILEVVNIAQFDNNVVVSGTFQFDSDGTTVNNISTTMDPAGGDDDTLLTESAIWDWVNTVSGVLQASTAAQTFIALTDTPAGYEDTKLVFSTDSDIQYASNLVYTGSGLVVSGTLDATGAVDFGSTLNVDGGADFNSTIDVDGGATLNSTLDVDGATTLNSSITVSGSADFQSTLDVDGAATLNNTLDVDGATTLNSTLDVDEATTLNSTLDVDGTTLLHSTLEVVSSAQFNNNVVVSGTLDVNGATSLNSTLDVDGATTLNSTLDVDQATTLNSSLDVDGVTTLNSSLDVDGATTLNSSVTVSGAADFKTTLNVDGAATLNNTLDVDGATTLNSTLDVDSASLFHSTIDVVGAATFENNVTVSGTFQFDADGQAVSAIETSMTAPGSDSNLLTEKAIYDWVNTVSGSLQDDVIWEVVDTPYQQIRPKGDHMGKAIYTSGDVTIGGDLTVSGTTTTINTAELTVEDKLITLNFGEAGAGITGDPLAGIEIDRGSEANYLFVFDEQADNFRVGVSGTMTPGNTYNLQAVCTREDAPVDMRVPWWDADDYIYRNTGETYISVNSGTNTVSVVADTDTKMAVAVDNVKIYGDANDYIEINSSTSPLFQIVLDGNTELDVQAGGLALDEGARVNGIVTEISEPGSDGNLTTEQAIVEYVTAVSGVLQNSINSFDTFIELTDTPNDYQNTKLVYSTGSDIQYAMNLSYDGSGLVVSGTLGATGAVNFDSTVDVDGATTLNSTLDVDGATTLNNTLDVDGATTLNSSVTVSGAADFQSTVDIDGAATLNSTLDVDGATTLNSTLDVDQATTLNSTLDVDGATTLNSTLDVDGATTLNSSVVVSGTANLQGAATLDSTLDVDGATTLNSTLDVDGATTLNSSLTVSGATDIRNTLNVTGAADFESNVTVTGTLDVDGAVDFDSTLNVAGASTFQTTINVQGAADFDSTVNVDGTAKFNSDVVFGTNVTVSGTFKFDAGGEDVNNISATMTPPGDDDTLLTAGAIWDWVNTVSGAISTGGSLNHNDLQGLQGGSSGEYYHLDQTDYTVLSAITSTQVSNWDTAYGWGDHAGLYSLVDHLHDDRYYTETEMDATVSGINSTIATTSGTLQAEIDAINAVNFYDVDMNYVNSTTWTYGSAITTPVELQVYVNGLKQRHHADYYTSSVVSGVLTVVFAFTTYSEDWVNATFRMTP